MKTLITTLITIAIFFGVSTGWAQEKPEWTDIHAFGGSGMEIVYDVTIDRDGNIISVGTFTGSMTVAGKTHSSAGNTSAIIIKQNANGDVLWSVSGGSTGYDYAYSVTTDKNGNIYVGGAFSNIANFGEKEVIAFGPRDAYVMKMDRNGDINWISQFGGIGFDFVRSLAIDKDGKIVITGWFNDEVAFGTHVLKSIDVADGYIAKMGTDGSVEWAKRIGSSGSVNIQKITVDKDNNYLLTGQFGGTMSVESSQQESKGTHDAFLAKFNNNGSLNWIDYISGAGNQIGYDIAIDKDNNVILSGYFSHNVNIGSTELLSNGYDDVFVAKYAASGSSSWAINAGGTHWDYARGIEVDSDGNYILVGYFYGAASFGDFDLKAHGGNFDYDSYIATISPDGTFLNAETLGGDRSDFLLGITNNNGNGHIAYGYFYDEFKAGSQVVTSKGSSDMVLAFYGVETAEQLLATVADWEVIQDSLYVSIMVDNASDLYYYSLEAGYDNSVMKFERVQRGEMMGQDAVMISGTVNDGRGISIGRTNGTGVSGTGEVLRLVYSLKDVHAGLDTEIVFQNIIADNSSMDPIKTESLVVTEISVEPAFAVWPGDANNDGQVDEADVLALGLHWGAKGEARPTSSITWARQVATPWENIDATFADTDGDGVVDHNDLRAISHNFGKTTDSKSISTQYMAMTSDNDSGTALGQLKKGEKIVYEVIANRTRRVLGMSARYRVHGIDKDAFKIHEIEMGDWAQEVLAANNVLKLNRQQDDFTAMAFMQTENAVTYHTEPGMVVMRITVEATKDWAANGFLQEVRVERVCPVDGNQGMQGDTDMIFAHSEKSSDDFGMALPERINLQNNYPNPFNPTTNIRFELPADEHVRLTVYNALGHQVATLVNQQTQAGYHDISFDATQLASGIYVYRLQAGGVVQTRKMTLVK